MCICCFRHILPIFTQVFLFFYFRVKMDELRMFLENEGWELCPVRSNFNLLQLLVSNEFLSFINIYNSGPHLCATNFQKFFLCLLILTMKKYHYNCRWNSLIFSVQRVWSPSFLFATFSISIRSICFHLNDFFYLILQCQ